MAGTIPPAEALRLVDLIAPTARGIASRVLSKTGGGNVTLFAFDRGEGLSEHTTPFDALALVVDGSLTLTIGGKTVVARGRHDRPAAGERAACGGGRRAGPHAVGHAARAERLGGSTQRRIPLDAVKNSAQQGNCPAADSPSPGMPPRSARPIDHSAYRIIAMKPMSMWNCWWQ